MEEIEQMKWFNEKYYFFYEKKKGILKIKSCLGNSLSKYYLILKLFCIKNLGLVGER